MASQFGQYISDARVKASKSIRDVARQLEISSTYLFDIEEGRRNPPSEGRIHRLAEILAISEDHLVNLALLSRKAVELPLAGTDASQRDQLAVLLARRWEGLSDTEISVLLNQLNEYEDQP